MHGHTIHTICAYEGGGGLPIHKMERFFEPDDNLWLVFFSWPGQVGRTGPSAEEELRSGLCDATTPRGQGEEFTRQQLTNS